MIPNLMVSSAATGEQMKKPVTNAIAMPKTSVDLQNLFILTLLSVLRITFRFLPE
jgi:hypothetical protein